MAAHVPILSSPSTSANSPNNSNSLCDFCHSRPKFSNGTKIHPYCGKTCADKDKSKNQIPAMGNQPPQTTVSGANCNFCLARPKYFDGTKTHPFCSKTCAKNANGLTNATGTCQAPNCRNPFYTKSNGPLGRYCSAAHKALGETLCIMCFQAPKTTLSHFCSQLCTDNAEKGAPVILNIPVGHVTFKSVANQFKASWRHATPCPPVRRVYKICLPASSLAAYDTYRTSYDLNLFGKKTGWGRFGRGIYTSSTSSKSNDYSQNDCKSNLKAILLNKVIVGKGYKLTHDLTSLTAPPSGFDSVLAEKGGTLNYDELVVYANDAIRPSFLVMYEP
ncbi:hypothetical protein P691DRAFT_856344 [Macrolepiota fuliginosa MF-IS2]|uniref:PARP catalytic domain-containing protein n=1 Tax=Macrolepiota fuliginosa MF-IS2 TaxID=1400762 RepID=A0A9P5WY15_9AGAR|nr:hypothetical protein P691DRAFT_856344 [Macrolepiota fuliginosa MF-IS2]